MIWFLITLLLFVVITLLIVMVYKTHNKGPKQFKEASLTLNKKQLQELENKYKKKVIDEKTYHQSKRELYERFVQADNIPQTILKDTVSRHSLWIIVVIIPIASIGLYVIKGKPSLPPEPLTRVTQENEAQNQKIDSLIKKIKTVQEKLPSDPAVQKQGYILLGNLELSRNHYSEAIDDFSHVLNGNFDPQLALQIGEMMCIQDHHVSPRALALFHKALDNTPADAPWKNHLMARIAQGEHEQDNP